MAQKLATWLVTKSGQKFTYGVACVTCMGIFGAYSLPHTFLLYKYKEIVQLYRYEFSIAIIVTLKVN